jgi:hypothetical protein
MAWRIKSVITLTRLEQRPTKVRPRSMGQPRIGVGHSDVRPKRHRVFPNSDPPPTR